MIQTVAVVNFVLRVRHLNIVLVMLRLLASKEFSLTGIVVKKKTLFPSRVS
jgi:hypothetical protein